MKLATPGLCFDPNIPAKPMPAPAALGELGLAACVRALGGWVEPAGLAPRAAFDRLVEEGVLEAWPGRPLYRAAAETGP